MSEYETLVACPACERCKACDGTRRMCCRVCSMPHMIDCPVCERCRVCRGTHLVHAEMRAAWLEKWGLG